MRCPLLSTVVAPDRWRAEKPVVVGDSLPHAACSRSAGSACRSKRGCTVGNGRSPRPRPDWRTAPGQLSGRRAASLHGTNARVCRPSAAVSEPTTPIQSERLKQETCRKRACGEARGEALSINVEAGEGGERRVWCPINPISVDVRCIFSHDWCLAGQSHERRALSTRDTRAAGTADRIKSLNAPHLWHQATGRRSSLVCALESPMTYRFSKGALHVAGSPPQRGFHPNQTSNEASKGVTPLGGLGQVQTRLVCSASPPSIAFCPTPTISLSFQTAATLGLLLRVNLSPMAFLSPPLTGPEPTPDETTKEERHRKWRIPAVECCRWCCRQCDPSC
jgi:hypothetical protein